MFTVSRSWDIVAEGPVKVEVPFEGVAGISGSHSQGSAAHHRPSETGFAVVQNPKRQATQRVAKPSLYPYYAGYTGGFVEGILVGLKLSKDAIVLDPWNGSGTTTWAASRLGANSIGFDLNPVMVLVAKARNARASDFDLAQTALRKIKADFQALPIERIEADDLLLKWLGPQTAATFRHLQLAVARVADLGAQHFEQITPAHALLHVMLFHAIREALAPVRGSNPTWIRMSAGQPRLGMSRQQILACFDQAVARVVAAGEGATLRNNDAVAKIGEASSDNLPVGDGSIAAVVTSPPYCTRIDYAVATLPELALLNWRETQVRALRHHMIGTPTVGKAQLRVLPAWGKTCVSFLEAVAKHNSKDSKIYYHKIYLAYFHHVYKSIQEIDRVLKTGGCCTMVVQDSFYKEILLDLQGIFIEMAEGLGWILCARHNFKTSHALSDIHPGIARYRARQCPSESVLMFRK